MSRFAVIPARALSDPRIRCPHIRLLLALSTSPTDANGWCWSSHQSLGKVAGNPQPDGTVNPISPGRVARLLSELREWGYIEVHIRYGDDGDQVSSAYRVILDYPPTS